MQRTEKKKRGEKVKLTNSILALLFFSEWFGKGTSFIQKNYLQRFKYITRLRINYYPMNSYLAKSALLLFFVSFISYAHSQDMILKKNSEIIKCRITEIGLDEVKYLLPDYPERLTFSIDKEHITKVVLENGQEMTFEKAMTNPESYMDNHKNAFKVDFLSPLTGNLTFGYEHSLKPGRSVEGTIGIIGLGIDVDDMNAGGLFVKAGYKFIKDPDFYLRGMRYAHILKGSYVKPEIALGLYGRDIYNRYGYYDDWGNWHPQYAPSRYRETVFSGTIQLVVGKQWVYDNIFLVDFNAGIGYGFVSRSESDYDDGSAYHFGYLITPTDLPMSFSLGLKIGGLFK